MEEFRRFLLRELSVLLRNNGFTFTEPDLDGITTFDIAARREDEKFLLKILYNVDTIREENAKELLHISRILGCISIVIGKRASNGDLEDNIVYFRHDVPIMTYESFVAYVNGEKPYIYSAHGGFYVSIRGDLLRSIREEKRYSIGSVSSAIGISRRSISLYETGSAATLEVYNRLQAMFQQDLKRPIDLLHSVLNFSMLEGEDFPGNDFLDSIFNVMRSMGFSMFPFKKTPFDAMATDMQTDQIIIGIAEELQNYRKAKSILSISDLFEKYSMVVSRLATERSSIGGCPVVSLGDVLKTQDKDTLVNLIRKKADAR